MATGPFYSSIQAFLQLWKLNSSRSICPLVDANDQNVTVVVYYDSNGEANVSTLPSIFLVQKNSKTFDARIHCNKLIATKRRGSVRKKSISDSAN